MSWFSSIFSSFKIPPPADSIRPQAQAQAQIQAQPPLPAKRILDEPSLQTSATSPASPPSIDPTITADDYAQIQENGRRRNKLIFAAGLAFCGLSIITTRRSLNRRRLASQVAFYKDAPAHHVDQSKQVSGALEAVEALNIATINVLSVAMMATGGLLWYLDLNSLADARKMIRGGLGGEGKTKTEQESEEEIEEFIASVLARKDFKEGRK